jgi:hypothetical protein
MQEQQDSKAIKRNQNFEYILAKKKKKNLQLSFEIRKYIEQNTGYEIPFDRQERKTLIKFLEGNEQKDEAELIRLENYLKVGRSLGATFLTPGGDLTTYTVSHTYNKNRVCYIWNYVKERKVRHIYFKFIEENIDSLKKFIPVHLVLTVPRNEKGEYKGEKFYGHLLLKDFNRLRTLPFFDLYCYGGEYGLETKKGKTTPGLHTHLHSFSLLYEKPNFEKIRKNARATAKEIHKLLYFFYLNYGDKLYNIEKIYPKKKDLAIQQLKKVADRVGTNPKFFQKVLIHFWQQVTGGHQVHVERLYTKQRNENGEIEYNYKVSQEGTLLKEIKKEYINKHSTPEKYSEAILECIKYHFKPDIFNDEFGNFDIPLIGKILAETKRKRLYSRFGAFYKIPELAISFKEDQTDEEMEVGDFNQVPDIVHEKTSSGKYAYSMFCPGTRTHQPKWAKGVGKQSFETDLDIFTFLDIDEKIPEVFKTVCLNKDLRQTAYNIDLKITLKKVQERLKQRGIKDLYKIYNFKEDITFLQNIKELLILLNNNKFTWELQI